jgi:hypothetical protein
MALYKYIIGYMKEKEKKAEAKREREREKRKVDEYY